MRELKNLAMLVACASLLILGVLGFWNVNQQKTATVPVARSIVTHEQAQRVHVAPITFEPIVIGIERIVDDIVVVGSSLTDADIESIRAAVESHKRLAENAPLDKPILSIEQTDPTRVTVTTGEFPAPVDRCGHIYYLQNEDGVWRVIFSCVWTS